MPGTGIDMPQGLCVTRQLTLMHGLRQPTFSTACTTNADILVYVSTRAMPLIRALSTKYATSHPLIQCPLTTLPNSTAVLLAQQRWGLFPQGEWGECIQAVHSARAPQSVNELQ
jgi:hypothetical protein